MKWEEFKDTHYTWGLSPTEIECPKCGNLIYRDDTVVLTTYPPQHSYICLNCDWVGTA